MYIMSSSGVDMKHIKENIIKNKSNTGLIILIVVAYSVYAYYKRTPKMVSPSSGASTKTAEILFFFTNWCPHCTSAKPEWNAFKDQYKKEDINGYTLTFTEYDCTKESPESEAMMEKYKVEGYPTIKLLVNGKVYDFDAKPSKQNLTQFVTTVLN